MKRKIISLIMAGFAVLMTTACGRKTEIKFTETESEEAISGDITRFNKVIAGTPINEQESLYDCTDILVKEGYHIVTCVTYGDNGLIVLYSGVNDSKLCGYTVSSGVEVSQIIFEGASISDSSHIYVINSKNIVIYDEEHNTYYITDYEYGKYTEIRPDFTPDSMCIADNGERMYYTLKNDANIYQYVFETGNSVSVYDFGEQYNEADIEYVEINNDKIIVNVKNENGSRYERLSVELQETSVLEENGNKVLYAGEAYIVIPDDESYVYVYNLHKPRVVEKFILDEKEETDNVYMFAGNPYLLTMVNTDEGNIFRFYNVSGGIKNNEITIPDEYEVLDISYLAIDQTMCFNVINQKNEHRILLWDVESVGDILN